MRSAISLLMLASLGGCLEVPARPHAVDHAGPLPLDAAPLERGPSRDSVLQLDAAVLHDRGLARPERQPSEGPPAPPELGIALSAPEQALLAAINAARSKQGLAAVVPHAQLMCAERKHVLDVAPTGTCGHVGTDGSVAPDRAKACGYPASLAWQVAEIGGGPGFTSASSVVAAWAADPPHAKFLFHAGAKQVGLGVHASCYFALFDCCVSP